MSNTDPDFGTQVPPDGPAAVRDEADEIMGVERDPTPTEDHYNGDDEIVIPEDETEETQPEAENEEG